MALNFPNSPTDGQVYIDVSTGNRWAWDSANTCWKSTSAFTQSITIAASAPGDPVVGQLWWNQEYGRLLVYYNDGTSTQWVDASPSDYTSTQAFNQSNNAYAMANASFNMANGSYTTANASFVEAAAANTNVGKAYNTANAGFDKANTALANTSGTIFNGILRVSGNVRTNTIQGYDGTNYIIDGYPRMPGQIIQHLTAPCNGRTVGPYTWPNVTATLSLDTTYRDVTGSVLSYTPPAGTNTVLYRFSWLIRFSSYSGISHYRFYIDSDEVAGAYRSIAASYEANSHANFNQIFEWSIQCNAATTNASKGEFTSWTSPKTLKLQAREYDNSTYQQILHLNTWRDGTGASSPYDVAIPILTIIAIA